MIDTNQHEQYVDELLTLFNVRMPPVPIESMLQHPRENMWQEVDITKLSTSFMKVGDVYGPRMSLARMLTRHIASSDWGKQRELTVLLTEPDHLHVFARMLIMPRRMISQLSIAARNPTAMSVHFQVPEEDARQRLLEVRNL